MSKMMGWTLGALLSCTLLLGCGAEDPGLDLDDNKADPGDGFSVHIDKQTWREVQLVGTEYEGTSIITDRIGEDKIVVNSELVWFKPGREVRLDISLETTNWFWNKPPGLRFMLLYRDTLVAEGDYWRVLYEGNQSYSAIGYRDNVFYSCKGKAVSSAFQRIRTKYPEDHLASVNVGFGCPMDELKEGVVSMEDLGGGVLKNTATKTFYLFVFPNDDYGDDAEVGQEYDYRLTVTCDGGPC